MTNLRIGTSGWNYPAGKGTWNGIFYPARPGRAASSLKRGGGASTSNRGGGASASNRGGGAPASKFDELVFYSEHFDTVEINTTFYGQPRAEVARAWAARTPANFEFSLKLYRQFTHERPIGVNAAAIDAFRRGIEPLANAGKIGALLAQFPPSFKHSAESQDYLDGLLKRFHDYPVAVELRHKTWSDHFSETINLLNARGAALAQIDEPKFRMSIRQNQLPNVSTFYYMRLHGRNAEQWWTHDKSEDRYNYLYSADELKPIADTADAARRLVKKFYLYFNNHFSAKAVVNAVMIKNQLGEPIPGQYSRAFLDAYPHLRGVVQDETDSWTLLPVSHENR
jgi:uncharacterized protein YecE (DUF72 family)